MDRNQDADILSIAERFGIPCRKFIEDRDVDPAFLERLPLSFVKINLIFPLKIEGEKLQVAISSPNALFALDDIGRQFSILTTPVLVSSSQILNAIHRFYERISASAQEVVAELNGETLDAIARQWEEPKDLLELTKDEAPIIKLLNTLIAQAVKERASDIHIEPYEQKLDVRFRIDGILYPRLSPSKIFCEPIVSRVKIMANMDIAEKRLPQDGGINLRVAGNDIDIRVSTVPTAFGERVVLRLLKKTGVIGLKDIGIKPRQVKEMEMLLSHNSGIILVTGPTGSGKTTTLYSFLNRINFQERNVITIEDPIEYQLDGIGQIQVNPKIDLTFANGLRSILRQDP